MRNAALHIAFPVRVLFLHITCYFRYLNLSAFFFFSPDSRHIKSGLLTGMAKSVWRAMQYQEYQGDPRQQGGSFVIGPGLSHVIFLFSPPLTVVTMPAIVVSATDGQESRYQV